MTSPKDQLVNDIARLLFAISRERPTPSEGEFFSLPQVAVQHYRQAAQHVITTVRARDARTDPHEIENWLWAILDPRPVTEAGQQSQISEVAVGITALLASAEQNERERIAAWLRGLPGSPIINRRLAAQLIEKGLPQ